MRRFLRNNMLILILLNSSNIFNYLFQLTAGRGLTTIDYGSFNAVNSMAVMLSAPVAVLPFVFSRYTVKLAESGLEQVKRLLVDGFRGTVFFAGALFLIGLVAIPWLQDFLHLEAKTPIVIMLVQLALSLVLPVFLGVIQGLHRFTAFGICGSSIAVSRFFSGLLFVLALEWGVNGALLSGTIGTFVAIGIGVWAVQGYFKSAWRTPAP